MTYPLGRARPLFVFSIVLAALALLASGITPSGAVPGRAGAGSSAPVADEVLAQLAGSGTASFWVKFEQQSDLAVAASTSDWGDRGSTVVSTLKATASSSQADVRSLLEKRGVDFKPFWVANTIRVTAGADVMNEIAEQPGVAEIVADGAYEVPKPKTGTDLAEVNAVEWNINRVRAPEVWDGFGTRGEGVVVANIDTGVQFDHEALVNAYRGNLGDGTFDHNYNWFDPSQICGSPSTVPCDNNSHGTHTMGTMVGDDGGENQIGVAPGAEWMAAKGCEFDSCSYEALLGSAQWVIAPTDLSGANPRPDLRPTVVNNSWGGGPGDPFYREMVQAWVAAGIFPVFANGNAGPGCGSVSSPGDYPESYGVGAFDQAETIAYFSGRGPSAIDGSVKPNISAPGIDVRSSVPGGYSAYQGTSMAAPHVAGAVALMQSAAPSLVGDVEATRALLDESAVDREDLSCGGEPGNNNVWGEGTLDTFQAVDFSPRGPTGVLSGLVTDAGTGAPLAGVRVEVTGPSNRRTVTGPDGTYAMRLPIGDFDVELSAFGYGSVTDEATVTEGETTTLDVALEAVPSHAVSGTVVDDDGQPVAGATVEVVGTPLPDVVTGADGMYMIPDVPEGEYELSVDAGGCLAAQVQTIVVDGDETVDFTLARNSDAAGYTCDHVPAGYVEGDTPLPLYGYDGAVQVDLPFDFWFYGERYDTTYASTNGFINFLDVNDGYVYWNGPVPSPERPNAAVYGMWDDLYIDYVDSVFTRTLGEAPNRQFVIEWRNVYFANDYNSQVSFEIVLHERGDIEMHYRNIDGGLDQGSSATIGIENAAGDDALQYSSDRPTLSNDRGIRFEAPDAGFVTGTVTDSASGDPLEGADVRALQGGTEVQSAITDENGAYVFQLPLGTYRVEASYRGEGTSSTTVVIDEVDETLSADFELELATISVEPDAIDLIVPEGESRTRTVTVGNTGDAPLEFEIFEQPVRSIGTAGPDTASAPNQAPAGYRMTAVEPSQGDGEVLLVMDYLPWGSNAMIRTLEANGVDYVAASSDQLATIDLGLYQSVIISNDQPQWFYDNYRAALPRLTTYVEDGGFLWMGAAWGYNGGSLENVEIPGGATAHQALESTNDVIDDDHPTMQGVPDPLVDDYVSHSVFDDLPEGTNVIMTASVDTRPTVIEYPLGAGQVLATGQYLEWAVDNGRATGMILENAVPYVHDFDPVIDVPWLSVSPTSGTVAPGASADVEVTVDTAGLEPGVHRGRVTVRSNDPRTPAVRVPVTVMVPEYQVAVDAGALTPYVDGEGANWAADQRHSAGAWGYTNGGSSRLVNRRAIGGTDEDPLYQTARNNPSGYRFDDVPNGTYQIEFRFAEINGRRPGRRLADVIAEQQLVLPAHDISEEVGTYNADDHTVTVTVTDGQLNVRLAPRAGTAVPILNGLRVTHLPDL